MRLATTVLIWGHGRCLLPHAKNLCKYILDFCIKSSVSQNLVRFLFFFFQTRVTSDGARMVDRAAPTEALGARGTTKRFRYLTRRERGAGIGAGSVKGVGTEVGMRQGRTRGKQRGEGTTPAMGTRTTLATGEMAAERAPRSGDHALAERKNRRVIRRTATSGRTSGERTAIGREQWGFTGS